MKEKGVLSDICIDDIFKELNKIVWTKENMEQNIIKMIGELDESC
mgnify:CR=1 FL=1